MEPIISPSPRIYQTNRKAGAKKPSPEQTAHVGTFQLRAAGAQKLPTIVDLRSKLLPVRDQGNTSECVAFSSCCMKEYQDQPGVYLSPVSIYEQRSNKDSEGMFLYDAMAILKHGVPAEWIFTSQKNDSQISISKEKHTVGSYGKVLELDLLKQALASTGVCTASFACYNGGLSFWAGSGDAPDGHCISIVGYNDDKKILIVRNSWGADWGDNGYTYMPYDQYKPWEAYSSMDGDGKLNPDMPVAQKREPSCVLL